MNDNDGMNARERLSALADGELDAGELPAALAFALDDEDGRATWQIYHLVGDTLRSPDLARPVDPAFMPRLRAQLAREALAARPAALVQPVQPALSELPELPARATAANAPLLRWKLLAGLASLAAVGAIGWTVLAPLQGADSAAVPLASAPVPEPSMVTVAGTEGQPPMIRDPRLDELLAAHQRLGSLSGAQLPTGFLRNATFDDPGR